MDKVLQTLTHWGIKNAIATPIASPSQSTWDVSRKYILKRNTNANELSRSIRLSELLTQEGILVAAYIPTENGQPTSPDGLYSLMTKLPGKHPDFYENPNLAPVMGQELARLHNALVIIEPKIESYDSDLLDDWKNKIIPSLSNIVSNEVLESVDADFTNVYHNLPRQLIHRDVHCHNVLFENERLTGWLDFDIGQRNVRIFDMAYLLSGLIIGNTQDTSQITIWRSIYRELLVGYEEVNNLSDDEHNALPVLMIVIEFLFVWFWNGRGNTEQSNTALDLTIWLYNEYRRGAFV